MHTGMHNAPRTHVVGVGWRGGVVEWGRERESGRQRNVTYIRCRRTPGRGRWRYRRPLLAFLLAFVASFTLFGFVAFLFLFLRRVVVLGEHISVRVLLARFPFRPWLCGGWRLLAEVVHPQFLRLSVDQRQKNLVARHLVDGEAAVALHRLYGGIFNPAPLAQLGRGQRGPVFVHVPSSRVQRHLPFLPLSRVCGIEPYRHAPIFFSDVRVRAGLDVDGEAVSLHVDGESGAVVGQEEGQGPGAGHPAAVQQQVQPVVDVFGAATPQVQRRYLVQVRGLDLLGRHALVQGVLLLPVRQPTRAGVCLRHWNPTFGAVSQCFILCLFTSRW